MIDTIELYAAHCKFGGEKTMHRRKILLSKVATRYPRLICNHHQTEALALQGGQFWRNILIEM